MFLLGRATMNGYELTSLQEHRLSLLLARPENQCRLPGAAHELFGRRRHSGGFCADDVRRTTHRLSLLLVLLVQSYNLTIHTIPTKPTRTSIPAILPHCQGIF